MTRSNNRMNKVPRRPRYNRDSLNYEDTVKTYLAGKIEFPVAVGNLRKLATAESILAAGELTLEKALKIKEPNDSHNHFVEAERLFRASEAANLPGKTTYLPRFLARAIMLKSYVPAFALMRFESTMPTDLMTEKIYEAILTGGKLLTEAYDQGHPDRKGISGSIAQFAVMALLTRKTLEGQQILATPATFSERRQNRPNSIVNHNWDIGLYSQAEGYPYLEHRLKVVASYNGNQLADGPGVSTIYVHPELSYQTTERFVGYNIIRACIAETPDNDAPSNSLNFRTQELFRLLERRTAVPN